MVGGYVIFGNKIFTTGENDLVKLYGGFENAVNYFNDVIKLGKPIMLVCANMNGVLAGWLEATATPGAYTFAGIGSASVVINNSSRTVVLQITLG